MKKNLLFALLFTPLFGWSQFIEEIYIVPENPGNTDEVWVVSRNFHPYSPCDLDTAIVSTSGSLIDVEARHNSGILTTTCTSLDSVFLGVFQDGAYQVVFTIYDNSGLIPFDSEIINFQIGDPSDISEKRFRPFQVFPNPGRDFVQINGIVSPIDFRIISVKNNTVKLHQKLISDTQVDISQLSSGIYIIEFETGDGNLFREKLIIE